MGELPAEASADVRGPSKNDGRGESYFERLRWQEAAAAIVVIADERLREVADRYERAWGLGPSDPGALFADEFPREPGAGTGPLAASAVLPGDRLGGPVPAPGPSPVVPPVPPGPCSPVEPVNTYRPFWIALALLACLVTAVAGFAVGAWLWKPAPAPEPAISVPAEVKATVGRVAKITAKTAGKKVSWYLASGPDTPDLEEPEPCCLHLITPTAGDYKVLAFTVIKGELAGPAECVVHVHPAGPTPPGPGPNPDPNPPTPPEPADPFFQTLKSAWQAETDPQKAANRAQLSALYRQAVQSAGDQSVTTVGQLFTILKAAASTLLPAGSLPKTRAAVDGELQKVLPSSPTAAMDQQTRQLCASTFGRVADDLDALK